MIQRIKTWLRDWLVGDLLLEQNNKESNNIRTFTCTGDTPTSTWHQGTNISCDDFYFSCTPDLNDSEQPIISEAQQEADQGWERLETALKNYRDLPDYTYYTLEQLYKTLEGAENQNRIDSILDAINRRKELWQRLGHETMTWAGETHEILDEMEEYFLIVKQNAELKDYITLMVPKNSIEEQKKHNANETEEIRESRTNAGGN